MVALTHGTDEQTLVCHPAPSVIFSSHQARAMRASPEFSLGVAGVVPRDTQRAVVPIAQHRDPWCADIRTPRLPARTVAAIL